MRPAETIATVACLGMMLSLASCVSPARQAPLTPAPPAAPPAPAEVRIDLFGTPRQGGLLRGRTDPDAQLLLGGNAVPVAPDGAFLIAFDRDAPAAIALSARRAEGSEATVRILSVAARSWDIQSVNAPITGSATTEAFQRLRAPELEQITAARTRVAPGSSDGWRQSFIWPATARISGEFGSQRIYRGVPGSYHSGVDIAAKAGTVFVAPADGVVILAADHAFTLEGYLLMIDHGMGLNSAFLHASRLLVRTGEVVRQGQPIGIVGATGRATGPHLHWGMKWGNARIDPLPLVGAPNE